MSLDISTSEILITINSLYLTYYESIYPSLAELKQAALFAKRLYATYNELELDSSKKEVLALYVNELYSYYKKEQAEYIKAYGRSNNN